MNKYFRGEWMRSDYDYLIIRELDGHIWDIFDATCFCPRCKCKQKIENSSKVKNQIENLSGTFLTPLAFVQGAVVLATNT